MKQHVDVTAAERRKGGFIKTDSDGTKHLINDPERYEKIHQ